MNMILGKKEERKNLVRNTEYAFDIDELLLM